MPLDFGIDKIETIADRILFVLKYKKIKWKFGSQKRPPTKNEVIVILREMLKDMEHGDMVTSGGICIQKSDSGHTDVYVFVGDLG